MPYTEIRVCEQDGTVVTYGWSDHEGPFEKVGKKGRKIICTVHHTLGHGMATLSAKYDGDLTAERKSEIARQAGLIG